MSSGRAIHWFRQDLRLCDNPSFYKANQLGEVLPVFILDDANAGDYAVGGAGRWWLHHSLESLNHQLGNTLCCYRGDVEKVLIDLVKKQSVTDVFWNRCYESWRIDRDVKTKNKLRDLGVRVHSDNGSLLWEPWQIKKQDGTPYKVFTPFYRRGCLNAEPPREPLPRPSNASLVTDDAALSIAELKLLPSLSWADGFSDHWSPGEIGAQQRLQHFLDEGLVGYKQGRDFPAKRHISKLSPHLHWGELSPNQVWYAISSRGDSIDVDHFLSELAWREFSYQLLYHQPDLPVKNLQSKFDAFPWQEDPHALVCWQRGQTGYPIVDAGMRELWQTGFMHNRVRMIVGSFLVKNLLLHWHHGERWFWDCLLDADLANNSASWQWIAGCGADAAPYFRIFNPVTQGQKFDPDGDYVRRYVPEIAALSNKYLFNPFDAPDRVLSDAVIVLGKTYPYPIVDLKQSRLRALDAFKAL